MIEFDSKEQAVEYFENQKLFFLDIDGNKVRIDDEVLVAWKPDYDDVQLSRGKVLDIFQHPMATKFESYRETRIVKIEGVSGHPNYDNQTFNFESSTSKSQIILKIV